MIAYFHFADGRVMGPDEVNEFHLVMEVAIVRTGLSHELAAHGDRNGKVVDVYEFTFDADLTAIQQRETGEHNVAAFVQRGTCKLLTRQEMRS